MLRANFLLHICYIFQKRDF